MKIYFSDSLVEKQIIVIFCRTFTSDGNYLCRKHNSIVDRVVSMSGSAARKHTKRSHNIKQENQKTFPAKTKPLEN